VHLIDGAKLRRDVHVAVLSSIGTLPLTVGVIQVVVVYNVKVVDVNIKVWMK
jgi:hypothetical protein